MIHALTIAIISIVAVFFRGMMREHNIQRATQVLVRECEAELRKAATR